jgi:hypothetical protein
MPRPTKPTRTNSIIRGLPVITLAKEPIQETAEVTIEETDSRIVAIVTAVVQHNSFTIKIIY